MAFRKPIGHPMKSAAACESPQKPVYKERPITDVDQDEIIHTICQRILVIEMLQMWRNKGGPGAFRDTRERDCSAFLESSHCTMPLVHWQPQEYLALAERVCNRFDWGDFVTRNLLEMLGVSMEFALEWPCKDHFNTFHMLYTVNMTEGWLKRPGKPEKYAGRFESCIFQLNNSEKVTGRADHTGLKHFFATLFDDGCQCDECLHRQKWLKKKRPADLCVKSSELVGRQNRISLRGHFSKIWPLHVCEALRGQALFQHDRAIESRGTRLLSKTETEADWWMYWRSIRLSQFMLALADELEREFLRWLKSVGIGLDPLLDADCRAAGVTVLPREGLVMCPYDSFVHQFNKMSLNGPQW